MENCAIGVDELVAKLDEKLLVVSRVLHVVDIFSCLPG